MIIPENPDSPPPTENQSHLWLEWKWPYSSAVRAGGS